MECWVLNASSNTPSLQYSGLYFVGARRLSAQSKAGGKESEYGYQWSFVLHTWPSVRPI